MIQNLSNDLLIYIFSMLPTKDLFTLLCVSQNFNKAIQNSEFLWKPRITPLLEANAWPTVKFSRYTFLYKHNMLNEIALKFVNLYHNFFQHQTRIDINKVSKSLLKIIDTTEYTNLAITKCIVDIYKKRNIPEIPGMPISHSLADTGDVEVLLYLMTQFDYQKKENELGHTLINRAFVASDCEFTRLKQAEKILTLPCSDNLKIACLQSFYEIFITGWIKDTIYDYELFETMSFKDESLTDEQRKKISLELKDSAPTEIKLPPEPTISDFANALKIHKENLIKADVKPLEPDTPQDNDIRLAKRRKFF